MLQQTRVAAVLGHYRRFLRRFPSVTALARAREGDVLAAWSGLGYYRRARMLHRAAKLVAGRRRFPRRSEDWLQLPGIGRYTAAAISSIAFGEATAVVDGNVKRVLSRLYGRHDLPDDVPDGIPNSDAWALANQLLDPAHPADFNQAMMELGALICLPRNPRCGQCPVRASCAGREPSREKKNKTFGSRLRQPIAYTLALRRGSVWLVQRARSESRMAGMWELPPAAATSPPLLRLRHSITNTDYDVTIHAASLEGSNPGLDLRPGRNAAVSGRWVRLSRIDALPLTGLTRKVLRLAVHADHKATKNI